MLRLVNFHPAVVPDYALQNILFLCVVDQSPVLSKWTVAAEGKGASVALEVFVVDDSVMHTYLSPFVAVSSIHECFSQHKFRKVNGYGRVVLRENHLSDDIKLIHKLRLTKLLLLRSRALFCLAERLLCEDEDVFQAETVKPHGCTREEREVRVLVDLA